MKIRIKEHRKDRCLLGRRQSASVHTPSHPRPLHRPVLLGTLSLMAGIALLFSGYMSSSSQAAIHTSEDLPLRADALIINFASLSDEGTTDPWLEEAMDDLGLSSEPDSLGLLEDEEAEKTKKPPVQEKKPAAAYPSSRAVLAQNYFPLLPGEKLALQMPQDRKEGNVTIRHHWQPAAGRVENTGPSKLSWTAPDQPGFIKLDLVEERSKGRQRIGRKVLKSLTAVIEIPSGKRDSQGRINNYPIGRFRTEVESAAVLGTMGRGYETPRGLIEVTLENKDLMISEHLRLGDFCCRWNAGQWPKYIALDFRLIEKLEALFDRMESRGFPVENVKVISGFRSPYYNRTMGRGRWSAHTFGMACDFFIDNDRDGRMDDLNKDGRISSTDARVIQEFALELDREGFHPGGSSSYSGHGSPFVHVDVRGVSVTW